MERELKLQVLAPTLWSEILQHPLLRLSETRPQALHAIYYDTPDQRLYHGGIAYRVRREDSQWVATIKLAGKNAGGLHQRPEWNIPVADPAPNIQIFTAPELRERLQEFLSLSLTPLLETIFRRREREIVFQSSRILLAADQGEIRAAQGVEAIDEVELELVEGSEIDLLQLGSALCAGLPLCPESNSKFARGLILLGRSLPSRKPSGNPFRPRDGAGTAISARLIQAAQKILEPLAKLQLQDEQGQILHDLRKKVRSLRALLRFAKALDRDDRLRGIRNGLAVWFHELGVARDVDALVAHAQHLAKLLPEENSLQALGEALRQTHRPARIDARVDPRARLAAELLALWAQLLLHPLSDPEDLRTHVEERLQRNLQALQYVDPAAGVEFHRLRIALKNLRYTLEELLELWPGKDSKALHKQLRILQESAGVIRDAQIAYQYLHEWQNNSSLAYSAGILLGYLTGRKEQEIRRFRKHWERLQEVRRPWD